MTSARRPLWAVGAIAAVLLASPSVVHTDFSDAQLYTVIGRHLVEDASWTATRYLPNVYPRFYEHLPFGFWLHAATIRVAGEAALPWVFSAVTLATVALAAWLTSRLAGAWAGLVAALVLAVTPQWFVYGGLPMLDPPLVLLTTASVAVLLVRPTGSAWTWLLAAAFALGGTAIKGPFGLLPFCAAVFARAVVDRSVRVFLVGAVLSLVIAAPVVGFVWFSPDWRVGYGMRQVMASAAGHRHDGSVHPLYPFVGLARTFWPAFPLIAAPVLAWLGRPRALLARWDGLTSPRALALVGWTVVIVLIGLCLPTRKLWHHALILYPLLAAWIGVALGPALERWVARAGARRRLWIALGVIGAAAIAFTVGGGSRWITPRPCVASKMPAFAAVLAPGEDVLVVHPTPHWMTFSSLAAEYRAVPWLLRSYDELEALPPAARAARWALFHQAAGAPPDGWSERERRDGWVFAARVP